MKPLIVSAPFGNYLGEGWATRTLGTFTLCPRPPGTDAQPAKGGRLIQVLRTVRYNPFKRSWRNKIGLRNPGIHSLHTKPAGYAQDKIISVHGFDQEEWEDVLSSAAVFKPEAIEINVSCPNVAQHGLDEAMRAVQAAMDLSTTATIIVKVSPVGYTALIDAAYDRGVRTFHLCNTIPTAKGGISGKPLLARSLRAVQTTRLHHKDVTIIGGGGVTSARDADRYFVAGADHVSIASTLFFPWNWPHFRKLGKALDQQHFDAVLDDYAKSWIPKQ